MFGSKVKVHPTFDTAFYKILNGIGDICEKTCDKVLLYVANKFLLFNSVFVVDTMTFKR